jgi:hypothetical protein
MIDENLAAHLGRRLSLTSRMLGGSAAALQDHQLQQINP